MNPTDPTPLPCQTPRTMNETPTQSPDQGQWTEGKHAFPPERVAPAEHNPDSLSPEQYGAPEWRLLLSGERIEHGDQWFARLSRKWVQVERSGTPFDYATYRRRVAPPTAEQPSGPSNFTLIQRIAECFPSGGLASTLPSAIKFAIKDYQTSEQRIAELERDNATLWEQLGDRDKLVADYRAQLAESEKALKLASTTMLKSMQHHGCDPCHLTEAIAAIDEAMKEALAKHFLPTTTENTKPQ